MKPTITKEDLKNSAHDGDVRREAILNSAVEQVRSLLESNYTAIVKAADESFVGDDNQTEPVAKATVSVCWSALAAAPTVTVKLGWSVRYSDNSEAQLDPLQTKLPLADDKEPMLRGTATQASQ